MTDRGLTRSVLIVGITAIVITMIVTGSYDLLGWVVSIVFLLALMLGAAR